MSPARRRGLLGGFAALAAPALPASAAAQPATSPDAELIRICARHPAAIAALNYGPDEAGDGPLWQAYARSRDAISAAQPTTIAGVLAKARAAKAEALNLDGSESPNCCPAEAWAWDLVNDLLRLEGCT